MTFEGDIGLKLNPMRLRVDDVESDMGFKDGEAFMVLPKRYGQFEIAPGGKLEESHEGKSVREIADELLKSKSSNKLGLAANSSIYSKAFIAYAG